MKQLTDYTNDPRAKQVTTRRKAAGNYQILYDLRLAGWLYQDLLTPKDPWRFEANLGGNVPIGWSITRIEFRSKREAMEYITASILFVEDAALDLAARRQQEAG